MRGQEVLLQNVICKHAMDAYRLKRCFIFREASMPSWLLRLLNFSPSFWVFKWTDIFGRWCLDASNREDKRLSLNGGLAKVLCAAHYGQVIYPEMVDIIIAWMKYLIDNDRVWSDCWLFKEDIKSCFPQLNMNPEAALHLAMRVAPGVILVNFSGTFGYTGLPGAWQVVGNALLWKVRKEALTVLHLFADDFFGFGLLHSCESDSELVTTTLKEVIGPGAAAPNKHELGQQEVILGWYINLIDPRGGSIRPKDEAIEKLIHMFFSFDELKPQPYELWDSLAGMVERFSNGFCNSRAHVASFHSMKNKCRATKNDTKARRHWGQKSKAKVAPASCRFSIEIWRVMLILA
jgi:hypothetical protein